MTMPAPRTRPPGSTRNPAQGEPAHKLAVAALARLTYAVADLAAAFETMLAEWYRQAKDGKRA